MPVLSPAIRASTLLLHLIVITRILAVYIGIIRNYRNSFKYLLMFVYLVVCSCVPNLTCEKSVSKISFEFVEYKRRHLTLFTTALITDSASVRYERHFVQLT